MTDYITIYGKPIPKANTYRIININGHASLKKSEAMKEYERNFYIQCPIRDKMIQGYFKLYIDVYYPSQRLDLDGCCKGVIDCMQQCRIFPNDNKCVELHMRKFVDKVNTRIEFKVEEVDI